MLLRSNKAFFPRSLARDFFFVVPAVCGCIAVQASADVLVIERATYLFFFHRSCIIRQREGERERVARKKGIFSLVKKTGTRSGIASIAGTIVLFFSSHNICYRKPQNLCVFVIVAI